MCHSPVELEEEKGSKGGAEDQRHEFIPDVQTKVTLSAAFMVRKDIERGKRRNVSDDCTAYGTKARNRPVTRNGNRGATLGWTARPRATSKEGERARTLWKSRRTAARASDFAASRGLVRLEVQAYISFRVERGGSRTKRESQ